MGSIVEAWGLQPRRRSSAAPKNTSNPCRSGRVTSRPRSSSRSGRHAVGHEIARRHRLEVRVRGKKAVDDVARFPRARWSTSRRSSDRAEPRATPAVAIIRPCFAAARRTSSGDRRQRISTSRRSVPRPVQGASSSTRSKTAPNGAPRSKSTCITCGRSVARLVEDLPQQRDAPPAHIAGDEHAFARATPAASASVFPPGAAHASRTRRSRASVPASKGTSCEASSCTKNSPAACFRCSQRVASRTTSPSGAYPVARPSRPRRPSTARQARRRVVRSVFARSVRGGS